jgi:WD40 repeat protein
MCKTELHLRTVVSAIAFALLAGCGGGSDGGSDGRSVHEFQIASPTNSVRPGESLQLRMIVQDSDHNDLRRTVTFSSSRPEVASISADGLVTALQIGSTLIRATVQDGQTEWLAQAHVFVQQPVRNKIAFVRNPGPGGSGFGIFLMNSDGSDQQLTVPSELERCSPTDANQCPTPWQRPSWHPDGMRLATSRIVILHVESFGRMIFLCSTAHPECDRLRPYPTEVVNSGVVPLFGESPAWSPQGERLAFSTRTWNPVEHSFAEQPSEHQLSWSPDGNRVAYVVFGSDAEVWIKNVDDSGLIRVTDNAVDDENPAWSPDGTQIAFATNRDGNFEIYLYSVGTGSLVNLTQHAGDDRWPSWSPDGTRIAFQSNRDGNEEIYSMSVDGSDQLNLTNHPAPDTEPAWSRN